MKILLSFLFLLACVLPAPASADRCFGAAGDQCGALSGQGFKLAACVANPLSPRRSFCNISAGSWTHDQCCFSNRSGNFCSGPGTALAPTCSAEMGLAISRAALGYMWVRLVDNQTADADGIVNRGAYCANAGQTVHRNDIRYCCNTQPAPQRVSYPFNAGRPSLWVCR